MPSGILRGLVRTAGGAKATLRVVGCVGLLAVTGCSGIRSRAPAAARHPTPVLLVHGLQEVGWSCIPLMIRLRAHGWQHVRAITLNPSNGGAPLEELSVQVAQAAFKLRLETGAERIDLVGMSMGGVVTRHYLQRLGGREFVRRYISISAPQHGTLMAVFAPGEGISQRQRESAILADLQGEPDPFSPVEVHSFWTPHDVVVYPPETAILEGSRAQQFPVLAHGLMPVAPEVQAALEEVLGAPESH